MPATTIPAPLLWLNAGFGVLSRASAGAYLQESRRRSSWSLDFYEEPGLRRYTGSTCCDVRSILNVVAQLPRKSGKLASVKARHLALSFA
jgi:hypothetical protein